MLGVDADEEQIVLVSSGTANARFITEDVPFGLAPLEALGGITGIALPLRQAGIALFEAICARDFRAENDLLPALNPGWLSATELHRERRGE